VILIRRVETRRGRGGVSNVDAERSDGCSPVPGEGVMAVADADGHVRMALGVYVLAAIDGDAAAAVEAHVLRCAQCRYECDRLRELPALLDLLGDEDVRDLVGDPE
jgi:hypothetical protein